MIAPALDTLAIFDLPGPGSLPEALSLSLRFSSAFQSSAFELGFLGFSLRSYVGLIRWGVHRANEIFLDVLEGSWDTLRISGMV